ncbi:phosphatidylinositol transfer protein csr1 [Coemansia thaxteri]|uniref:Phosphatidylinositol transfer protein csr1 n=1 Tax=Coemansia thaxteri TaxID=2663907 RepID=A0A9W8BGB3_9FUNG|nr:phosphatidylinositol transfer protein csr1 [Coemansia thaxteri]KAJ2009119.1 phosphatidylinositol transfer protein csr1 [Coemansia thaxteri]KAJ2474054.1 phosphatidylinositol transfer protein csr1 [Coemansia sp. RSA 2322]KAJ2486921.1 phosphatidylinositol transfer protein csr1 [Coemansia sp. RSA 2320]
MTNAVLEQYDSGTPISEGTLGHLTPEQDAALRDLWTRLLDLLPTPALDPLSAPTPSPASASSLSPSPSPAPSAPLPATAKRTSRLRLPGTTASASSSASLSQLPSSSADKPHASNSSNSGGWFGFGAAKTEPTAFRQLVGEVAPASSRPPERAAIDAGARPALTMREAFWSTVLCDNPDVLLLRFLRARKWRPDDALAMLVACLRWRQTEDVDRLVWTGESQLNLALMRSGVGAMHRTDRIGQPVLYVPVRLNDPKAQPPEHMVDYTVYLMEVARVVLHPPVEKVCLLVDTTDMSMSNMDWNFFRTFLTYLEHYYPECLGLVLIYNASWVFHGLWKLIRPLLDPVVASKVHFAADQKELQRFIAPENLPLEYGGTGNFSYTYAMPEEKENAPMFDVMARDSAAAAHLAACDEFETATRAWAAAVTTAASQPDQSPDVDARRNAAASGVVAASKAMDKFCRARTQYHRTGIIAADMAVNWTP